MRIFSVHCPIQMKIRTATCQIGTCLMGLALRADLIGDQTEIQGAVKYPNQGPDSVAYETQAGLTSGAGWRQLAGSNQLL